MKPFRITAIAAGVLFLVSDAASIAGLILYQPLLHDATWVTSSPGGFPVLLGAFLEILTALAVAGTAVALYPVLKRDHPAAAMGYLALRVTEGLVILMGVVSLLAVVSLSRVFAGADAASYQTTAGALVAFREWTFLLGPNIVLGINATLLGLVLVRTGLVPRWIACIPVIDGPLIFISGIAVLFGLYPQVSPLGAVIAAPMLVFEVAFAIRLIATGFNER